MTFRRATLAGVLALLGVAASTQSAAAHSESSVGVSFADPSICIAAQPAHYEEDDPETWDIGPIPAEWIPPALRPFLGADTCAYVDRALSPVDDESPIYTLFWDDLSYERYLQLLTSLEADGWLDGGGLRAAYSDALGDYGPTDYQELLELPETPVWSDAHLSLSSTGVDNDLAQLLFTWNPTEPPGATGWRRPGLVMTVDSGTLFPAQGIDDPSILSTLKTIAEALPTPTQSAVLGGAAVMLTLVIGWPGALVNSVVSSRYDRLFAWAEKGLTKRIRTALKKTQPRWLVWVGFVAAAVVSGFVDPAFGPNLMSLRMLASAFLAFLVFNVAGWALVKAVVNRVEPDAKPVVNFRWGSLLIVLGAVFVARLLQFEPGVVFGLVAGLTFALTLAASRKALVVVVGSGFALAAALLAWTVFSILSPIAGTDPILLFVTEFFSGVTIEGISSLPLALLPFTALDGGDLFAWRRWVWGVAYAMGVAAFMLVLLTVPDSFTTIPGNFAGWLTLFGIYALVAIGAWALHGVLERRSDRVRRQAPADA